MRLISRDSIARDIKFKIFTGKTVWELIFPDPREGIHFVSGGYYSDKRLYEKMYYNVKARSDILGGQLKGIYINLNNKKQELNYKNADKFMGDVISKHLAVTFKIMVKNKYYEFKVRH